MPKETAKRSPKEEGEKKTRRSKKDADTPKRGLSAYMFFSKENRNTVKEENPEATFGELGKILGAKWKAMDEKEKEPYVEMAAKDKKRYEDEKAALE
ncbi:hypothetical protein G6F56_009775 [Rhizopus delemar]|nr:hypothetical protein G6F56_009775 [Rhizopus delemar]